MKINPVCVQEADTLPSRKEREREKEKKRKRERERAACRNWSQVSSRGIQRQEGRQAGRQAGSYRPHSRSGTLQEEAVLKCWHWRRCNWYEVEVSSASAVGTVTTHLLVYAVILLHSVLCHAVQFTLLSHVSNQACALSSTTRDLHRRLLHICISPTPPAPLLSSYFHPHIPSFSSSPFLDVWLMHRTVPYCRAGNSQSALER